MIMNLTPHTVNVCDPNGVISKSFESEGIARCSQSTSQIGVIDGISITSTVFGEVEGLPKEKNDVFFIVSRLVLNACPNRKDLLVPNELIRDEEGRIIGCMSLANN